MGSRLRRGFACSLLIVACGSPESDSDVDGTGSTGADTSADTSVDTTAATAATSDTAGSITDTEATDTEATDTEATDTDTTDTDTTEACVKNVVLMGYWPPTNEMLRRWSESPTQNPDGWQGENWHDHGFNVYAFFPEFPPDGDPTNDMIGDEGSVGSPESDLRVDYQDTSADFWRIVDTYQPVLLITTSRGGDIGWEIEAREGGHGDGNDGDPAYDWVSDGWAPEYFPTQATVDERSWQAVSMVRQDVTLPSQLPMDEIYAAVDALGLASVKIDQGTSGNYLSGFLGLHGLTYNAMVSHNAAAGHIHVGASVAVADAEQMIEATLEVVLTQHPADSLACPPEGG